MNVAKQDSGVNCGFGGVEGDSLKKAASLLYELLSRIRSNSESDREDRKLIRKLFDKALKSNDNDEVHECLVTIVEVLQDADGDTSSVTRFPLSDSQEEENVRPERLQKWTDHVSMRVRKLREEKGMKQQEVAERAGITQSHLSRIECGRLSPSRFTLEKLARALSVNLGDIDPVD